MPRSRDADRVVGSVCPYCGRWCAQKIHVKDEKVIQIRGTRTIPSAGAAMPEGFCE